MTVKDRVGRGRHIVLAVSADPAPSRGELTAAIREALPGVDARLTRFDGASALVRVPHAATARARAAFAEIARVGRNGRPARIVSLGTSGTLRAAVRRFAPALARRAEQRP